MSLAAIALALTPNPPPPPGPVYRDVMAVGMSVRNLSAYLREEGYDVAGVDFEKNLVTVMEWPWKLVDVQGVPVSLPRQVFAPDQRYRNPDEVNSEMIRLANLYPAVLRGYQFGSTTKGRPLYTIKISAANPMGQKRTQVMFDAGIHAREVMTPEIGLDIIDWLAQHASDAEVQAWLQKVDVWVVPQQNPDGNARVWSGDSMWRKNDGRPYSTDQNRNFPEHWGKCQGSSSNPTDETYRGPSAGSEPETKAFMYLNNYVKPAYAISYHSFSEIVIFPLGCPDTKADRATEELGKKLAELHVKDSGRGTYAPGYSYDLLYNVSGGSTDWQYAANGTKAFTVEVNSSSAGFQPPYSMRDSTVERARKGWQYLIDVASKTPVEK